MTRRRRRNPEAVPAPAPTAAPFPWRPVLAVLAGGLAGAVAYRLLRPATPVAPPAPLPAPGEAPAAHLPTPAQPHDAAAAPSWDALPIAPAYAYAVTPIAPSGVYAGVHHCPTETTPDALASMKAATVVDVANLTSPTQFPNDFMAGLLTSAESAIHADRVTLGMCPESVGLPVRIANSAKRATAIRGEMARRGVPATAAPVQ